MTDEPSSDAAPVSGEVAALAAEATKTAAEAEAHVQVVAEHAANAVAAVEETVEDEVQWLTDKLATHETLIRGIATTVPPSAASPIPRATVAGTGRMPSDPSDWSTWARTSDVHASHVRKLTE